MVRLFGKLCVYVWRGKEGGYLCGSEEADGVEVFHGLSASVVANRYTSFCSISDCEYTMLTTLI